MTHRCIIACKNKSKHVYYFSDKPVFVNTEWCNISNIYHVQDDENSGHGIAPQEDAQSDAGMTTLIIYHQGLYLTQEVGVKKVQSWWGEKTNGKCHLKRSMVLAALRTFPYIPGLSWSLKRTGVFLCLAPEKDTMSNQDPCGLWSDKPLGSIKHKMTKRKAHRWF